MNKHRLIIAGLLLAMTLFAKELSAQVIKGEAFGGFSIAQVDGDDCYGYERVKGQVGIGALVPITDWMDVGLEIQYNPKGAFKNDSIAYSSYLVGKYDLKLNYMEIPVMLYLTDKARYTVGLGASFGRLVGFSEKINGVETNTHIGNGRLRWVEGFAGVDDFNLGSITTIEDLSDPRLYDEEGNLLIRNSDSYKKNDFSVCADFRIRIWEGLHAQVRYQYSFVPIRTRLLYANYSETIPSKVRLQYNNQISFRLTYIFGEDRAKINRIIQKEEKQQKRN